MKIIYKINYRPDGQSTNKWWFTNYLLIALDNDVNGDWQETVFSIRKKLFFLKRVYLIARMDKVDGPTVWYPASPMYILK